MKKTIALASLLGAIACALPAHAQFAKPEDAIKYRKAGFTLTAAHFATTADPPTVTLPGGFTKNGKDATIPLSPAVVPLVAGLSLMTISALGVTAWAERGRSSKEAPAAPAELSPRQELSVALLRQMQAECAERGAKREAPVAEGPMWPGAEEAAEPALRLDAGDEPLGCRAALVGAREGPVVCAVVARDEDLAAGVRDGVGHRVTPCAASCATHWAACSRAVSVPSRPVHIAPARSRRSASGVAWYCAAVRRSATAWGFSTRSTVCRFVSAIAVSPHEPYHRCYDDTIYSMVCQGVSATASASASGCACIWRAPFRMMVKNLLSSPRKWPLMR